MVTLNEALASATLFWDTCKGDSRMMPIRAKLCTEILGGSRKVASLSASDATRLLTELTKGRQRSTVQAYYAAFKRMIVLAGGNVSAWPAPPKAPRKRRTLPQRLTSDRLKRLLADLRRRGFEETAELIEVLATTGMRSGSEALAWDAWLDTHEGLMTVQGKGSHERVIPLQPSVIQLLEDVEKRIKRVPYNTHYKRLKVVTKGTDLEGLGFHDFRRRYATEAYARSKDILAVRDLLGHADISTTMLYVGTDVENLRRAAYDS